jgi:hypothetical protein
VTGNWRKSKRSGATNACVELSRDGRVRDSKNPGGSTLDARGLLALARAFTRTPDA